MTPSYQVIPDDRMGTPLQQNTLAPAATHRPSLPVRAQSGQAPKVAQTANVPQP